MRLTVSGVSKAFGATPVLDDISLEVPQGSRTAIVGASGSGKSTLLRLIAGFEEPDAGRILLGDRLLAAPGTSVPAHRRGIGYVAQDGALFPHLTVGGQHRVRPAAARRPRRPRARGDGTGGARPGARRPVSRTSSRAGSSSGSRSPAPSRRAPASSCSTSRSARSTRACASRPAGP